MIKYVSNLASNSSSPKIDISCKLIKISNTSYSSNTTALNAGNVLFYHIKFNGLTSNDKIYQTYLTLVLLCPTYSFSMKLYYVDSLTTFPSSASSLYSAYESSKDTIYDQIAVPTAAAYNDNSIQVPVRFDLTEIIQNIDETNPEFIIAISTDNPSNHSINIINIADYSLQIEFISATCVDLRGVNNINKFDILSLSNHYEGYLNLSNGNLVNIFKSFKTTGKKMPIEINVSYVFNRQTNTPLLYDKFSFNFEYSIYLENNLYIIEDYTGNRRAYQKIDRTISSFALKNMGIGHTELEGDIYYCYEDCSYFYFTIGSDGQNVIQLYDQNDNYYLFYNLNSVTQLRKIKNANSEEINFTWTHIRNNPNYLIGISNSDNDQVTFTYDSRYRVSQVNFVNEKLRADFTTSDSNFWMKIYNNSQCIRMFKAELNNLNISVIEEKTYANNYVNKMTFSYDTSSRLTQVNYYKGSSTLLSYQKYSYGSSYTKASDHMNNYYYYYFDRLGRVRTIIDDKGKTKTFNYDEIGNSAIKGVISQQEGISQTRNYIDNSRFEFLDDNNELLYWDKEGSPLYSLSSDGVHKDKYLYINNNSESFSLKQTSKTLPVGDYILKIKANPIISSGITVRITLKYEKFVKLGSLTGGLSEITIMPFQENYDITGIDSINTWKTYSTNKISVTSAMIDPYVIISIIVPENERIYLDDFVFSKINQVSRYNLVNNGFSKKKMIIIYQKVSLSYV